MNYDKLQQTALRLISKNGRDITLKKLKVIDNDVVWGGEADKWDSFTQSGKAVFVMNSSKLGKTIISDELLAQCQQICILQPMASITQFDHITDNSVDWKIKWIHELTPANLNMLYIVGVAR